MADPVAVLDRTGGGPRSAANRGAGYGSGTPVDPLRRRRRLGGAIVIAALLVLAVVLRPRGSSPTDALRFEVSGMRVERLGGEPPGVDMNGLGYEVEYLPGGELVVDLTLYGHRPTRITEFDFVPRDLEPPALYEQVDVQIAAGDATTGADLRFEPMRPFSLDTEGTMTVRTRLRFANCEHRAVVGMGVGTYPEVVVEGEGRRTLDLPWPVAVLSPPDELCPERR